MILEKDLQKFFEDNNIPLECERSLSKEEVAELFLKARQLGTSFAAFILCGVINGDRDGITTSFGTWSVLYDCYCSFITGFTQVTSPNN